MKNRNLILLACMLWMYGCSDDSKDSGKPEPSKPLCDCQDDEICVEGECKKKDTPPDESCDPKCAEGKQCIDGRCAVCIGKECFFDNDDTPPGPGPGPVDETCEDDTDCTGDNQMCSNGQCVSAECDPKCPEDQTCVRGRCKAETLLWDLCNNQADCITGQCIYYLTPSKEMQMEVNGEFETFSSNNPIPVPLLDERINAAYYNLTHPESNLDADTMVGICTYECTKESAKECPTGWSCQVMAHGVLSYPTSGKLPYELESENLEKTPFAALCRPNVGEPFSAEMCTASESGCKAAGLVFYEGMCLEPCDDETKECPFLFSCEAAQGASGAKKVCMPVGGTCGACYDRDGDGAGFGHCEHDGIDCDDDNPNAWYQKPLTCDDITDDKGKPAYRDLNCNGYIDRFELLGNKANCSACGEGCHTANGDKIDIQCVSALDGLDGSEWYKTASADAEVPTFQCVEKCAFGYGDCSGNAKCNTQLLEDSLINQVEQENLPIPVSKVKTGNGAAATIYARDTDGDGFPAIDNVASVTSKTETTPAEIILDGSNTVICCSNDTDYCYTANKEWTSLKISDTTKEVTADDGTKTTISYVAPCGKRLSSTNEDIRCKDGECSPMSPDCYDSDDEKVNVNPLAIERCDGVDNDGSQILLPAQNEDCAEWCKKHTDICASFTVKTTTEDGDIITYRTNPYCDATPEGLNETSPWVDPTNGTRLDPGDGCTKYHANGALCNDSGTVMCMPNDRERCTAGSENCGCALKDNKAFMITDANQGTNPEQKDYIRYTEDLSNVQFCRCDNSHCDEGKTIAQCNSEGKDTQGCFELCGHFCTMTTSYTLTCNATLENVQDGLEKQQNDTYITTFNGVDENCNGLVDEDAWVPCIITENYPYDILEKGVFNGRTLKYTEFASSNDYSITNAQNTDKSINLCRIGILKAKPVQNGNEVSYQKYCAPIYRPRKYDFYGDGVDANCDGADYDVDHTTFIVPTEQGTSTQSPDVNASCKYEKNIDINGNVTYGKITPCGSINMAINGVSVNNIHRNKAKDDQYEFYHDVLINGNMNYTMGFIGDAKILSPIYLPAYDSIKQLQYLDMPSAKGLADFTDENEITHIHNEHFLSAYGVHKYLVDQLRKNPAFDANRYLFSYSAEMVQGSQVDYVVADGSEMMQPKEVFRIFGGFERSEKDYCAMPTECDYWTNSGHEKSTISWIVTPQNDRTTYSLVDGENLSLRMTNLTLSLSSETLCTDDSCKKDNVTRPNNKPLADGVTLIGINGTRGWSGVQALTLDNTTITVTAPAGYSYDANDVPAQEASGIQGWVSGFSYRIPKASQSYNVNTNSYPGFNFSVGCDKYEKAGDDYNCYNIKNREGKEYIYSEVYEQQSNALENLNCGYGLQPNAITQSTGGMGGYAHTNLWRNGVSWDKGTGRDGLSPRKKVGGVWKNLEKSEYGQPGCGGSAPHLFDNDGVRDSEPAAESAFGSGGQGGMHGAAGKNSNTKIFWDLNSSALSVRSDRSKARGSYGQPGGGGGGGGVDYCWEGRGSTNHWCYASAGGSGGCGGRGGEAGGTGGSALGIVLKKKPWSQANLQLLTYSSKDTKNIVNVTNGNGGKPQYGGMGGNGGWNMYYYSYHQANINGIGGLPTQTHKTGASGGGGGGGAGGMGGGGKAGWAYPYVFVCDASVSDYDKYQLDDFKHDSLESLGKCGFAIPKPMQSTSSQYGTQTLSGKTYDDPVIGAENGKGATALVEAECDIHTHRPSTKTYGHWFRGVECVGGDGGMLETITVEDNYTDNSCKGFSKSDNKYYNIVIKPLVYTNGKVYDLASMCLFDRQCGNNMKCKDAVCYQKCTKNSDCSSGKKCEDNVCVDK